MSEKKSIAERAEEFHRDHPEVFTHLRELALKAVAAGHGKLGIGQLFEVLRWERMLSTSDADGFKLNNDFRSWYSRKLMADVPGLEDVFDTRESKVDAPPLTPPASLISGARPAGSMYADEPGAEWF